MNKLFCKLLILAVLLVPATSVAQPFPQYRPDGIWVFRALFPGQTQPVYTGTGRFRADGTLSGPPIDQHSGPAVGEWTRVSAREFGFTFVANTYDELGNFRTTNRVRGMMKLSGDGLSATGKTMVDILDTTGQIILSRGTMFTGERVVVEPF
jgi:hypothetical protein